MIIYRGYVIDKFSTLPTRKTKYYQTYFEAHQAAEKLAKKYGDRAYIRVE